MANTGNTSSWVKHVPEPLLRAVRTFLQAFTTIWLAAMITPNLVHNSVPHRSALWAVTQAAAWGGAVAVVTLLHNSLEDAGVLPAVLKPNPVVVDVPVPAPAPQPTPAPEPTPTEIDGGSPSGDVPQVKS